MPILLQPTARQLIRRRTQDWIIFSNRSTWQDISRSVTQYINRLLRNPEIYVHVHKNTRLDPVRSQMNPLHNVTTYLKSISVSPSCLLSGIPSGLLLQVVHLKFCVNFFHVCDSYNIYGLVPPPRFGGQLNITYNINTVYNLGILNVSECNKQTNKQK